MFPVALTMPPVRILPPVMLPVPDIAPPAPEVKMLPPVTLALNDAVVPTRFALTVVSNTVAAVVMLPVALTRPPVNKLPPVIFPGALIDVVVSVPDTLPMILAAYMLPDVEIVPEVNKLPPVIFAEALMIAIASLKDRHGKFVRVRLSEDRDDEQYFCNQIAEMMLHKGNT